MRIKLENQKWKWILGMMLAVLCPVSCMVLGYSLKAGLALMGMALAVTALRLEIRSDRILRGIFALLFPFMSMAGFLTGLIMQNCALTEITLGRILINTAIHMMFQLIVLLICANLRAALTAGSLIPFLLTLANAYVMEFRGNALTPSDFLSIQTAANVAAEYNFTPSATILYALLLMAILLLAVYCVPRPEVTRTTPLVLAQAATLALCVCLVLQSTAGVQPLRWSSDGAQYNGYLFNFILQMRDIRVSQPEGYAESAIENMAEQYPHEDMPASGPDIIIIMDESFSDFRVFDGFSQDDANVMPCIDSMRDNTIRGFLTASIFGGSTANSEYECLSGNTMGFLPDGSIVYQQYYSEDSWSLVSFLKGYDYNCIAMHPYHANGWMRDTVYPKLGFEELYFLPDFPQEQLIREYVSDREMFEQIIRLQEAQDTDTPMFLFGVTMQNHGGYAYEGADFVSTVSLDGLSGDYPLAEQYLSLAKETDCAVEYLIEHYKNVERDTVIVFFGDHMPKLEPAFYEEINGGPFDTLDEQMKKQMVPFFIWANFDIEEREIPCSSINYLPLYTLEAAGLPLPPYMQFLKDTEAVIPAINAYGYYSQEKQCFLPLEEASGVEAEAIRAYKYLQYNNMFDNEHRSEHFIGN